MKWETYRKSTNVVDKRKRTKTIIGIVGATVLAVSGYLFGPAVPKYISKHMNEPEKMVQENFEHDEHAQFVRSMLAITEDSWSRIFTEKRLHYQNSVLVLFTDKVQSSCGGASSDIGPFYCSGDHRVYIDLSFFKRFDELLKMPGDAVQAYVIFHEVGHHVQNLLGTMPTTFAKIQREPDKSLANKELVKLELQADCYAGITFNKIKYMLEPGDVTEMVNAASKIGDDFLQLSFSGSVVPDSFTHGTSEQRAGWLLVGYNTGSLDECNTFTVDLNKPSILLKK